MKSMFIYEPHQDKTRIQAYANCTSSDKIVQAVY